MPEKLPKRELDTAWAAINHAVAVRAYHRRRTRRGSTQRETDIKVALDRLRDAMRPLRRLIATFPYGPQTDHAESNRQRLREASYGIQSERRKLWKMRKR